ncbi:alpha/beta fold hydrolase [Nocardia halotolerans]|uniref:Alpha/beta fold hydrolase n=1 Tax=Nocardia halotolerans TaxID=1755878 RepID=A0ABV8VLJ2_9NOCA
MLLLHANPGDHRDFGPVLPALGQRFAVAAVDWPGYGESTVTDPAAVTMLGLADVAATVWDALAGAGYRDPVVVGNSVGGYAAVRLAQRRSMAGVVLVQPAGFVPLNAVTRAVCRTMGRPGVARRAITPAARLYLGAPRGADLRAVYERAKAVPGRPDRLQVYCSLWRGLVDPSADLTTGAPLLPGTPVQVVWGRYDPVNPWLLNRAGLRRQLPHAEVAVLAARHESFCENPALFLRTVTPFLDRCAAEGTAAAG